MAKVYFVIYKEIFKNVSDINPYYSLRQDICIVEDEDIAKHYCSNRHSIKYDKVEFEDIEKEAK